MYLKFSYWNINIWILFFPKKQYQPSISFSISSTEHHTKGYAESSGDDGKGFNFLYFER